VKTGQGLCDVCTTTQPLWLCEVSLGQVHDEWLTAQCSCSTSGPVSTGMGNRPGMQPAIGLEADSSLLHSVGRRTQFSRIPVMSSRVAFITDQNVVAGRNQNDTRSHSYKWQKAFNDSNMHFWFLLPACGYCVYIANDLRHTVDI